VQLIRVFRRHLLWDYRGKNKGTSFGNPSPNGNPGFNSGVILLHLDRMKTSSSYQSYLDEGNVKTMAKKCVVLSFVLSA